MRILNRFHLSYCTNIHPGNDWAQTFRSLQEHVPQVKAQLCPDEPFGLGLRLSDRAARELLEAERLLQFKEWLKSQEVYVFTINGFPFGNFHGESVKDRVHEPDWTQRSRLEYTLNLAHILSELLPEGVAGGISTSPITYRHWYSPGEERERAMRQAADHLCELAEDLEALERQNGAFIHIDIEPEPDGLLENSRETIDFFHAHLLPMARERAHERNEYDERAAELVHRYIGLCYDVCHFALAFEQPGESLSRLQEAGIRIGKIQLSAALALRAADLDPETDPWELMGRLQEPIYLHQVTRQTEQKVLTFPDIPDVLEARPEFDELRAHFHVPVFSERMGAFRSTNPEIVKVLNYLRGHPDLCEHLEVETYTWEVLPEELKIPLTESIVRELRWCRNQLIKE